MRVAVVGGGVVGLSTAVGLMELGAEVVCFERGDPMGERSAGETRIFRLAHAHPDLVELAHRARRAFAGWSERAGTTLIENVGTVVSGEGTDEWVAAMAAAGADHEVVEAGSPLLRLPAERFSGPALVDPAGGVIRVDRVKAYLTAAVGAATVRRSHVYGLEETGDRVRVWAAGGSEDVDAAVLCAGAGTSPLAATAGIYPPPMLEHHVRFSFPVRPGAPRPMQCWIDRDRPATYQHAAHSGTWTVGAHVDGPAVAWEVGPDAAERASREVVTDHVARHLPAIEPRVVGRLYCAHNPDLGDGFRFLRRGRILTVYGENLFKFAPLLGTMLARAATDGTTPTGTGQFR